MERRLHPSLVVTRGEPMKAAPHSGISRIGNQPSSKNLDGMSPTRWKDLTTQKKRNLENVPKENSGTLLHVLKLKNPLKVNTKSAHTATLFDPTWTVA